MPTIKGHRKIYYFLGLSIKAHIPIHIAQAINLPQVKAVNKLTNINPAVKPPIKLHKNISFLFIRTPKFFIFTIPYKDFFFNFITNLISNSQ